MRTIKSHDIHGNTYEVAVDKLAWRPSAYAIIFHDSNVLLIKQHGKYHLPGGGVDLGELPENAAIREVKEESGVTVNSPRLVDAASSFFTYDLLDNNESVHVQSILLYYRCTFESGELSTNLQDEYEKRAGATPEWVPSDKLGSIEIGSTFDWRGVVRAVL